MNEMSTTCFDKGFPVMPEGARQYTAWACNPPNSGQDVVEKRGFIGRSMTIKTLDINSK